MTLQGHTRLKIWLVLVVVFVLGSITGAALTGLYRSRAGADRPEKAMHDRFEKMRRELNLMDEQTTQIRAILDETRNDYRKLREELRPRFEEPRQKARAKIRALLTPEQQQKFDAMVAQQDAQRESEQRTKR
jgi:Spy/CpxP family protein refolding chaperone